MFPYWILFSLCALGAVQNRGRMRQLDQSGPLLVAFGLFVMLMVGLRDEVGGDWLNYIIILEEYRYRDLGEAILLGDPAYSFLNWLAWRAGIGIWFVNLVCAAVFAWGLIRFSTHQPNPWLALVVAVPYLIIVVAMGYTRQAVAIGLILAGLSALRRNPSMVRFAFYIVAAALFHRSAIIVLPLVALAATRNRWVIVALGAVLGAMLYYLLVDPEFDSMVQHYVREEYDAQGALIRVGMNAMPAVLFLAFQRGFAVDEADRRLWRNFALAALAALVLLMLIRSSAVVDRLALYLIPLQLVVFSRLPFAFSKEQKPNDLLTLAVILYSAAVLFVWLTAAYHAHFWLPYKTVIA